MFLTVVKHIFITIEICEAERQAFRFVVDYSDKFPLSEIRHFL